jgi:hypothetical protein
MLDSVAGLGLHDHVCWIFDDEDDVRGAALQWFEEGLRLGQRLLYVGAREPEALNADLARLDGVAALVAADALRVVSLPTLHDPAREADGPPPMARYAAATEDALADGYTGLRVAADLTRLAVHPTAWEAQARWESEADRYMASMPLAVLCCYDRREVPGAALADIASFHPLVHGSRRIAPFRLFATQDALALSGDVDGFSVDALNRLLGMAAQPEGGVLDIGALEFIDHRGVLALVDHARADGGLSLRAAPPMVRRLCTMLDVAL